MPIAFDIFSADKSFSFPSRTEPQSIGKSVEPVDKAIQSSGRDAIQALSIKLEGVRNSLEPGRIVTISDLKKVEKQLVDLEKEIGTEGTQSLKEECRQLKGAYHSQKAKIFQAYLAALEPAARRQELAKLVRSGEVVQQVDYQLQSGDASGVGGNIKSVEGFVREKRYFLKGEREAVAAESSSYRVGGLLGEGGMGKALVLKADSPFFKDKVLKLFHDGGEAQRTIELADRLRGCADGIEVGGKFVHVGELSVGDDKYQALAILKFYGDCDLSQVHDTHVADGKLNEVEWRMKAAGSAVNGITFAVDHQILHLDLKAGNLFVNDPFNQEGRQHFAIADWGGAVDISKEGLLELIKSDQLIVSAGNCRGAEVTAIKEKMAEFREKLDSNLPVDNKELDGLSDQLIALQVYNAAVLLKEILVVPETLDEKEFVDTIDGKSGEMLLDYFEEHDFGEMGAEEKNWLRSAIATPPIESDMGDALVEAGVPKELVSWIDKALTAPPEKRLSMLTELRAIKEGHF